MYLSAFVVLFAFLVVAALYVKWVKHPELRPLAAYLMFVLPFSAIAFVLFTAVIGLLATIGRAETLFDPIVATLVLLIAFVPAFLVGRWQVRKPPRRRELPD